MRRRSRSRISTAPLAVASDGAILVNAAEFALVTSFDDVVKNAKASGLPVFVGVVVAARNNVMKAIEDAAADVAGRVGGRAQRQLSLRGRNRRAKATLA